jgi:hypothetical protein
MREIFAAAVIIAVVTVAARAAVPVPVEAGAPSDLINTPVCAGSFEDARDCQRIGWPEGRRRSPQRAI